MILNCAADKPPTCSTYSDYLFDTLTNGANSELRPRSIPLMQEKIISDIKLSESFYIKWNRPVKEYFEFLTTDSFSKESDANPIQTDSNEWEINLKLRASSGSYLRIE